MTYSTMFCKQDIFILRVAASLLLLIMTHSPYDVSKHKLFFLMSLVYKWINFRN